MASLRADGKSGSGTGISGQQRGKTGLSSRRGGSPCECRGRTGEKVLKFVRSITVFAAAVGSADDEVPTVGAIDEAFS